jgi:hypothetical protein
MTAGGRLEMSKLVVSKAVGRSKKALIFAGDTVGGKHESSFM